VKRVVIATNVIVSSALSKALVLLFEKWVRGEFTVVVSSEILGEYFEVLYRPKFKLKQETIDRIIRYLYRFSEFVVPAEKIHIHLLELKEFHSIPICSAREFLDSLEIDS